MIVDRTVFINPVEPEFLAFRLSSGVDTKVRFHLKAQTGAAWNEDVLAQLQLTSRSRDRTDFYSAPSIDTANGVAQAVIPAGLAYDPNGWRLRLTGTVSREPRVIAYGVVTAVAGAGPQVEPQDVIDNIPVTFVRGADDYVDVKLWQDANKGTPFDIASVTVSAPILSAAGGSSLTSFTVTQIDFNEVRLSITAAQLAALPDSCWWLLQASTVAGTQTLAQGQVTVTG
jgi:hypothetical protein